MTANARQAGLAPEPPNARLQQLIAIGFSQLSTAQRAEADALVAAFVADHLEALASGLLEDVRVGRFTKRFLAGLIGVSESYLGDALRRPHKLSERVVAAISVTVPGYSDAYAELRRRADVLYLPSGLDAVGPPAPPGDVLVRVRAVADKELASIESAAQRLRDALQKVGSGDV